MKTRTNRIVLLCLVALIGVTAQAQKKDAKVLASSKGVYLVGAPNAELDEETGMKTVVWHKTEDRNKQTETLWAETVPTAEDFNFTLPKSPKNGLTSLCWELTEEGKYTVLHCYFQMPADVLKNFWLASDETGIVDKETGIHYRAIRSVPDCWGKYFAVKASKGSMLDFQIYFPKLPVETTEIAIYGVPNWQMRGRNIKLKRAKEGNPSYDVLPTFHTPRLVKEEGKYHKDDADTWVAYTDAHLIKPVEEGTMALWRTSEATYLAYAKEQNWMREYFGVHSGTVLVDESGNRYKLKELVGLPIDRNFWMEGYSGDYFALVYVFEPLPLNVETISFMEPDGEPFKAWGANWEGQAATGLDVEDLRQNQSLFEYNKRKIFK